MANKQILINEIETMPTNIIDEILRYALVLKQAKPNTANGLTLASEYALTKEWLLPEEEATWEHL